MSGLNSFFRKKTVVGTNGTYGLTPLGKTKAEDLTISGAKGQVAAALNENGASSITDIAEETRMSPERVKNTLKILIRNGYVRKVNTEE